MGYKEARAMLDASDKRQKEFEREMGGPKVIEWMRKERLRRLGIAPGIWPRRRKVEPPFDPRVDKQIKQLEARVAKLERRLTKRA
jgi:hypothetical protein